jgi:hypothetical protein
MSRVRQQEEFEESKESQELKESQQDTAPGKRWTIGILLELLATPWTPRTP